LEQTVHAVPVTTMGSNRTKPAPVQKRPGTDAGWPVRYVERFQGVLAAPVSGASLAICRIAIGLVTILEVYSMCNPSQIVAGKIPAQNYFIGPEIHFNFPYSGFEWLPLLPERWFYALLGVMAFSGLAMALGLFYRVSAAAVFLTSGYLFAVESTRTYYQSYYYIELLFTCLMMWMPAARRYSLDAWFGRNKGERETIPFWPVFLLRSQLVVMYFFGGVAKLNADWLLDAAPLRWALREAHVGTVFEPYLSPAHLAVVKAFLHDVRFAYFLSYAGVVFDLGIGFLLLIRRTRILGLILMAVFHATNHFIIYDNIDWFPLVGLATALIFLEPDWPERFWAWARRPRFAKPDWGWLVTGAVLIPGVGAALGWKLKPTTTTGPGTDRERIARTTLLFVAGWLIWQVLLPLRHYFIPGDARITYEGLSFSWRLKTDEHKAVSPQIFVRDAKVILPNETTGSRVDWNEWRGEKVLYRIARPSRIDWRRLPEIVVLLEPLLGERIIYNPYSGSATPRSEAESQERVKAIWDQHYHREPASVRPTGPLPQVLDFLGRALKQSGKTREAEELDQLLSQTQGSSAAPGQPKSITLDRSKLLALLGSLRNGDSSGVTLSALRLLSPFSLEGGRVFPGAFLAIEDPALLKTTSSEQGYRVDSARWKTGPATSAPGTTSNPALSPMVVLTGDIGAEAKTVLPQACIFDSLDNPERPPYIFWNTLKDVNMSKLTHISNQPFYLRRYARRIAGLWEKQYGRRPVVTATTAVSLNRRPHQAIVDPNADLASVPVTWFGHNPWVRDLETPRIPATALTPQSGR
jgi:vitamin K-dependent gamma-carboxylase